MGFPLQRVSLPSAAVSVCPTAIVWRGDSELPTHQQGFKVLGIPLGHPDFVQRFLEGKIAEHRVLLERIPEISDTQSAWLLLSFAATARANFFLRGVNPDHAKCFAAAHDQGVWQCFCRIMQILPTCGAQELSSLPTWEGGIGLRSARRTQPAAHRASWADALKMVKERNTVVADTTLGALQSGAETSSAQAILKCSQILHDAGFESPAWSELAEGRAPGVVEEEEDPANLASGGSRKPVCDQEAPFQGFNVAATVGTRAGDDAVSERSTCQHPIFSVFFWTGRQGLTQDLSERSCFAGFVCPFPCLFAAVGVAVYSTPLATTVQLAQQRVGAQRLGVGVRRSTGVQRRRCQSSGECVRA